MDRPGGTVLVIESVVGAGPAIQRRSVIRHRRPTVNEGLFHFLFDYAEREPIGFISILVGMPVLLLFLAAATLKRVHPVVVWVVLAGAFFAFSQVFPENRNQKWSIGIGDGVICGVLVCWWFGRVAPELREKLRRRRRAG